MNVINKLNENIIGIYVIHVRKHTSDVIAKKDTWTYSTNTRMHSASTNMTWAWPRTSHIKFTSNHRIQSNRSN